MDCNILKIEDNSVNIEQEILRIWTFMNPFHFRVKSDTNSNFSCFGLLINLLIQFLFFLIVEIDFLYFTLVSWSRHPDNYIYYNLYHANKYQMLLRLLHLLTLYIILYTNYTLLYLYTATYSLYLLDERQTIYVCNSKYVVKQRANVEDKMKNSMNDEWHDKENQTTNSTMIHATPTKYM